MAINFDEFFRLPIGQDLLFSTESETELNNGTILLFKGCLNHATRMQIIQLANISDDLYHRFNPFIHYEDFYSPGLV